LPESHEKIILKLISERPELNLKLTPEIPELMYSTSPNFSPKRK